MPRATYAPLLALALAGCGGSPYDDAPPAQGDPSPVADAPAASVIDPDAPPPIGTDVGAAQGDTASVVVDTGSVAPR